MLRSLWLRKLSRALFANHFSSRSQRRSLRRTRLNLEHLEDRTLLSAPVTDTTGFIAAINSANTAGGSTTITLASGTTFDFTTANNSTKGGNALPVITSNITIVGNGDTIERTGPNAFRLLDVAPGGSLNLQNVTLAGGSVTGSGGGITNFGTLMVSDCTISGNAASNQGGGIDHDGIMSVSDSTLSGNSAGSGGGVYNSNQLTISDSTLSGNSAQNGGGVYDSSAVLTVSNSTLSGNSVSTDGGGVFLTGGGNVALTSVTLYGNSADTNGGGGAFAGASEVIAHNTLVASNKGGDIGGAFDSASSYNLIGDGSGGLSSANHNLLGTSTNPIDPKLAPLANNGGPTQTLALLAGSPAIGAGDPSESGSTDQRGFPRGSIVDIGAFQTQPITITVNDTTHSMDNPANVTLARLGTQVTLIDAINAANNSLASDSYVIVLPDNQTITFTQPLNNTTITSNNVFRHGHAFLLRLRRSDVYRWRVGIGHAGIGRSDAGRRRGPGR